MSRAISKDRPRKIYEWERGSIANIGTITTIPYDIIFRHIKDKNLYEIVSLFFSNYTRKIHLLDQCVLEQFWWIDSEIIAARYSQIEHPSHYSGEYIFDRNTGERTILEIRQPDIDGKHWKTEHIHIKRGQIDPNNECTILRTTFNEHIELGGEPIEGVYIIRL